MTTSGYKTNKTGFKIGTGFEYYDDFRLGLATSHFYERISTDQWPLQGSKSKKEIIGIVL